MPNVPRKGGARDDSWPLRAPASGGLPGHLAFQYRAARALRTTIRSLSRGRSRFERLCLVMLLSYSAPASPNCGPAWLLEFTHTCVLICAKGKPGPSITVSHTKPFEAVAAEPPQA
ncbi:hypothetical protein GCM10009577_37250 [Streptomyces javensis]